MRGFAVQTTDQGEVPNHLVLDGLKAGIARIGWASRPAFDLRKLAKLKESKRLTKEQHEAWRGNHLFLDAVAFGDLLFYRNQPVRGRVTVVKVTGEYDFASGTPDFRSSRTCKILVRGRLLKDFPAELRRVLSIQGRFYRIKDNVAFARFINTMRRSAAKTPLSRTIRTRRRSAALPKEKTGYSYLAVERQVRVLERHERYKKQLKTYLEDRDLKPEFERDFIDVRFSIARRQFFGELKVSDPPSIKESFRMAVGQLLDYRYSYFHEQSAAIMFLDCQIPREKLDLATKLGIAVVCHLDGIFSLCNPKVHSHLMSIFPPIFGA
jgi:hypothetical protein